MITVKCKQILTYKKGETLGPFKFEISNVNTKLRKKTIAII